MSPAQRRQVEEICDSALSLEPGERAGFLDRACSGDAEIRRLVESLLAGEERARTFLETAAPAQYGSPAPAVPKQILHYEVLQKLGEGGMGLVYKARDTRLDRFVALKVLRPGVVGEPEYNRRFIREAKAASALNHPNIVTVYDIGSQDGTDFLVMEYIAGRTLANLIEEADVPLDHVIEYAMQTADALAAAHGAGIIHRDLKPGNIMITAGGRAKILDFGLAKRAYRSTRTDPGPPLSGTETPTAEGAVLGTPAYMAPEQFRGQPADARGDIWALGVVLYEMAAGVRPFQGATAFEMISAILGQPALPLPERVAPGLRQVIERCLEKDPALRYQHAEELRADLQAILIAPAARKKHVLRRWPFVGAVLVAVLSAAIAFAPWRRWASSDGDVTAPAIESLAVLPFVNAGGGPDADYLSVGLAEGLITRLSQVPRLKVKSRDTVIRYKGQDKDIRAVVRELGVRAVLRGRLQQRGTSLTITAELVDAADGTLLWRREYDRKVGDILAIEQEISQETARCLRTRLTGEEQRRVAASSTQNAEAYRIYLQGRYYWSQRYEESLKKSADYFRLAIEKDPGYALAWAGLADSFLMLGGWSCMPPGEAYPKARAAALRAIQMEETLAEPHATLGYLKTLYEWDWAGAEREFRRAIELNPGYATAHHWYAFYFLTLGSLPQALEEIERAREAEPLSPIINWEVAYFYSFTRHYDRALIEAQKAVGLDPAFQAANGLGRIYAFQKRSDAEAQLARELQGGQHGAVELQVAATSLAFLGRKEEAYRLLHELLALSRKQYVLPALLGLVYGSLGDRDRAFTYFDQAVQERSLVVSWLRDPVLDPIRSDKRWAGIFRRVGLQP